ncbi:MAG: hypothetical protein ACREQ7_01510 [Candidatus Binatia bacterium]
MEPSCLQLKPADLSFSQKIILDAAEDTCCPHKLSQFLVIVPSVSHCAVEVGHICIEMGAPRPADLFRSKIVEVYFP